MRGIVCRHVDVKIKKRVTTKTGGNVVIKSAKRNNLWRINAIIISSMVKCGGRRDYSRPAASACLKCQYEVNNGVNDNIGACEESAVREMRGALGSGSSIKIISGTSRKA